MRSQWVHQSLYLTRKKAEEYAEKMRTNCRPAPFQVVVLPVMDPDGGRQWIVWALLPPKEVGK